jgi:hypothetical protein
MTDTTPVLDRIEKEYCNALAREKGLDPVGYAGMFDGAIVLEIPLPWPRKVFLDPDKVTPEVVETVQTFYALPPEQRPRLVPMAIAPDHEYSIPGFRRFIRFNRQPGAAQFERIEYLVPEQHYGKLAQAALIAPERLSEFAPYRVDAPETRDLMVCTHGAVDAACAKFGFTLYRYLRQNHAGEHLRVWRCTHFGGHVFAPTLIDLPIGQYWAYVETPQADQIASRAGDHHNRVGRLASPLLAGGGARGVHAGGLALAGLFQDRDDHRAGRIRSRKASMGRGGDHLCITGCQARWQVSDARRGGAYHHDDHHDRDGEHARLRTISRGDCRVAPMLSDTL